MKTFIILTVLAVICSMTVSTEHDGDLSQRDTVRPRREAEAEAEAEAEPGKPQYWNNKLTSHSRLARSAEAEAGITYRPQPYKPQPYRPRPPTPHPRLRREAEANAEALMRSTTYAYKTTTGWGYY